MSQKGSPKFNELPRMSPRVKTPQGSGHSTARSAGWDAQYFHGSEKRPGTSQDPRVIRRFSFDKSIEKRLPRLNHFDVKLVDQTFKDTTSAVPSKSDYLRLYYTDFLGAEAPGDETKLKFVDGDECTVECEELRSWLDRIMPRSRTEAFPLFLLLKDVLRRLAGKELRIISSENMRLSKEVRAAKAEIGALEEQLQSTKAAAAQQLAELKKKMEEERMRLAHGSGVSDALREEMEAQAKEFAEKTATMEEEASAATQRADKMEKDAAKFKREAAEAKQREKEALSKLKSLEAVAEALKGGAGGDPLAKMDETERLETLNKLLRDDTIAKTQEYEEIVSKAVVEAPPYSTRRTMCGHLLADLTKHEPSLDGGSALALVCKLVTAVDADAPTVLQMISESLSLDLAQATLEQQAALVQKQGSSWFATFDAISHCIAVHAQSLLTNWGGGKDGVCWAEVRAGMDGLGIPEVRSKAFFVAAAGRDYEREAIRLLGAKIEAGEEPAGAEPALDGITIGREGLCRALGFQSEWHYLVQFDPRTAELWRLARAQVQKELEIEREAAVKCRGLVLRGCQADELGKPDVADVLSHCLGATRDEFMVEMARTLSSEPMRLAWKADRSAREQRKRILRCMTATFAHERQPFVAWWEEVQVCKAERKAAQDAKEEEQRRRARMKKPGSRNLSMYDGGKPIAVKTLGTQIAGVYEAKVQADDLDDAQGRKRAALPDFLKNFLIRQYGLKSIAMKNLQNMAAGVRKEWENNLRLKVFGQVAGMIEDDRFSEGHCDLLCQAFKNLFPPEQIKERLSDRDMESIPIQSVAYATLGVFTSKYYFRDEDDIAMVEGEADLGTSVKQQLLDMADGDKADPNSLTVNIDKWTEWLIKSYDESRKNAELFFEKLYDEYEVNKDNILDFTEFCSVIKVVDAERGEEDILRMYNDALEVTGEGDNISSEAFVHISLSNHLACMKQAPAPEKTEGGQG